jgi:hypothetical protein
MVEERTDPKTKSVTKIIPLMYPVPVYGKDGEVIGQVHQVELGRPKVKHLRNLPTAFLQGKDLTGAEMRQVLLSLLQYEEKTIDDIDLKDVGEIVQVVREFLM